MSTDGFATSAVSNGSPEALPSLTVLRTNQTEFESYCESMLDEMETLHARLGQREHENSEDHAHEALHSKINAMENEREMLVEELENVRHRAAESSDAREAQQRDFEEERNRWKAEFELLRRTLSEQSRPVPVATREEAASSAPPTAPPVNDAPPPKDRVLDSVLAQFEMIQQDIVRRRTLTQAPNH